MSQPSGFSLYDKQTYPILNNPVNGRVNLVEQPSTDVIFNMQEKINIKNKATEFRDPLVGIWENNVLEQVFFSKENVQIIQNGIRAGVYKLSRNNFIIPPQNIDTLKIIMRSTYLQYAQHKVDNITKQVERLNQLVWDYAVPTVYKELVGYYKYCQDQSRIALPLEIPREVDRDFKQLELKPWF
jgi:hypothetical protein